jgi:hypothetical protein
MKIIPKLLLTLLLGTAFGILWAPPPTENNAIIIEQGLTINPYLCLWEAVCKYESNNNPLAYNAREQATGIAQIRPVLVRDYNQRTGRDYVIEDMYNVEISKEIFMYYASQLGPYSYEQIARKWNGSGPATDVYWNNIKKLL